MMIMSMILTKLYFDEGFDNDCEVDIGGDDDDIFARYIQYDSWFYYKGSQKGVKEWISMPSIFPNGMQ